MVRDLFAFSGGLAIAASGGLPLRAATAADLDTALRVEVLTGPAVVAAGMTIAVTAVLLAAGVLGRRLGAVILAVAAIAAIGFTMATAGAPLESGIAGFTVYPLPDETAAGGVLTAGLFGILFWFAGERLARVRPA